MKVSASNFKLLDWEAMFHRSNGVSCVNFCSRHLFPMVWSEINEVCIALSDLPELLTTSFGYQLTASDSTFSVSRLLSVTSLRLVHYHDSSSDVQVHNCLCIRCIRDITHCPIEHILNKNLLSAVTFLIK